MTVHILYPEWLPKHMLSDTQELLQSCEGPTRWKFVPLDYEEKVEYDPISPEFTGKWPSYVEEFGFMSQALKSESGESMKFCLSTPPMTQDVGLLINRIHVAVDAYAHGLGIHMSRMSDVAGIEDLFLVVTTRGTPENLFEYAIPMLRGVRVFQINHSVTSRIPAHLFLAYHAMSMPLRVLSRWDDRSYAMHEKKVAPWGHEQPLGCINDIAHKDMRLALMKIKTADICDECIQSLRRPHHLQLVMQIRQGLEAIRSIQLRFDDLVKHLSLSKLVVGRKVQLSDLGQTLPFSPRIAAVYLTFLEAGEEGIVLKHIGDYVPRLTHWYGRFYKGSDPEAMEAAVNRIINPQDGTLNELISKANAVIRRVLGEMGSTPYLIMGAKGQPYQIKLDRAWVHWEGPG